MIKTYKRDINKPRGSSDRTQSWSEKQRYEAVALYKLLGSLVEVHKQTTIPVQTLRQWHIKDWWKDYELELAQGARAGLSAKLEKIRDRAMLVVEDRLANGDFVYNQKTGDIVRKPVNAAVANKIFVDSIDKAILVEKLNSEKQVTMSLDKINDRLLKLHETFTQMTGKARVEPLQGVIDAEYVVHPQEEPYALPDQRETGLQAGTGQREEERTIEGEAEVGAESSSTDGGPTGGGPSTS